MNWKIAQSRLATIAATQLFLMISPNSALATEAATVYPYRYLDWVSPAELAAMPKNQRPQHEGLCEGIYLQPVITPAPLSSDAPEESAIRASSDQFDTLPDGTNILTGDVVIRQGGRQLQADEVILNRETRASSLKGSVVIRQPGMLILGESAKLNLNEKEVDAKDTEYVLHNLHVHGSASRIYNPEEKTLVLDNSTYTTCEPNNTSWQLQADKIILNQESGWGEVSGASLEVGGVPVIYLPWWMFPIDDRRQSGFLFPTFGSGDNGFDISTPYYLNLAPNLDATFIPRFIADRGDMLETEFRYLTPSTEGDLGGSYLSNDKQYEDTRWLITWHHLGNYDNWVNTVDYTKVSDSDYFLDLDTNLNTNSATYLRQRTDMSYFGDTWNFTALLQQFQTIDELIVDEELPYRMLPQLRANGRFPIDDSSVTFEMIGEYTYFDHPKDIELGPTNAERVRAVPSASYELREIWGFVVPKLAFHYRYYNLNQENLTNNEQQQETPVLSLDSGLYFDRHFQQGDNDYLQTLEPRLFYLYVPYRDQSDLPLFDTSKTSFSYEQLYRNNRFTGGDRLGDADQVSLGLTSRFIEQDTGLERFSLSLGQIFYLRDREVQLSEDDPAETTRYSPLVSRLNWMINPSWTWRAESQWDSEENNQDGLSTGLQYRSKYGNLLNLTFNYYDQGSVTADPDAENIKQSDLSFAWNLSQRWSAIGRWGFDLDHSRSFDNIAGLEYESCCWRVRVVNRRYLKESNDADDIVQPSQGIFLQFELKGLGGVGSSVDSMLGEAIPGYEDRERNRPPAF